MRTYSVEVYKPESKDFHPDEFEGITKIKVSWNRCLFLYAEDGFCYCYNRDAWKEFRKVGEEN